MPLRVEVMHCVYEYRESSETDIFGDPITVSVEKPVRVYTLTSNLKKSMSIGFTPKAGDNYRIYAYWGTGKDDYVSSYPFTADAELLVFTSQPASGSYDPETLKFNAIWTTSFTPVKLEIMKCTDVYQTGNWFNSHSYSYIVTEKTRVMGIGGPLHANCSYPFEPDAMADVFLSCGVRNVVIKLGGKGCYFKSADFSLFLPAYEIKAVDATGAGDNFVAGFASEIIRGSAPKAALAFANACGAICTTAIGAGTALKSRDQVLKFMDQSASGSFEQ